jgi:hypothetical protein
MKNTTLSQNKQEAEKRMPSEEEFEIGAAYQFFPEDLYQIMHSTHDYTSEAKRYIRSSPDPGFQFGIRHTDVNFWVECKFRENKENSERLTIFTDSQLAKYKSLEHSFLFLCTNRNGKPANYFIPFNHISDNELNFSFIEPYRLSDGLGIRPGMVHKYLKLEYKAPMNKS